MIIRHDSSRISDESDVRMDNNVEDDVHDDQERETNSKEICHFVGNK